MNLFYEVGEPEGSPVPSGMELLHVEIKYQLSGTHNSSILVGILFLVNFIDQLFIFSKDHFTL
jgi:hypothetical protein